MKIKSLMFTLILMAFLLVVVINYIYLQHKTRNQFIDLQSLIKEKNNLNADWGRLQIEHSTLVNNSRIETKAKKQLNMKPAQAEQILNIRR